MVNSDNVKVGDYIIDYERIYVVFDRKSDLIYFRVAADDNGSQKLTCSIPCQNLTKAGFRKVISRNEAKKIMASLSNARPVLETFDIKLAKEIMYANDWTRNITLLESIRASNKDVAEDSVSRTSKELVETIISHMVDEISFVTGESPKSVHQKIARALGGKQNIDN